MPPARHKLEKQVKVQQKHSYSCKMEVLFNKLSQMQKTTNTDTSQDKDKLNCVRNNFIAHDGQFPLKIYVR